MRAAHRSVAVVVVMFVFLASDAAHAQPVETQTTVEVPPPDLWISDAMPSVGGSSPGAQYFQMFVLVFLLIGWLLMAYQDMLARRWVKHRKRTSTIETEWRPELDTIPESPDKEHGIVIPRSLGAERIDSIVSED